MRYILIALIANIVMSTEGGAKPDRHHNPYIRNTGWSPNEWVLVFKDHNKLPESVRVFPKKDMCLKVAQAKTIKSGVTWTCVGVDPN